MIDSKNQEIQGSALTEKRPSLESRPYAKYLLWSGVLVLAAIFVFTAFYILRFDLDAKKDQVLSSERPDLNAKKGRALTEISPYTGRPIAEISEDPSVSKIYPQDIKNKYKEDLLKLADSLKKDPESLESWIKAGVIKKFFGDYAGARDLWEYAGILRPKNSTSFYNLAGLYAFYLKDFAKAEANYKIAIKNAPHDFFIYTSLADLYRYQAAEKSGVDATSIRPDLDAKKGRALVEEVIKQGISANPETANLYVYLGGYYKEIGEIAKAIEAYEAVLKIAPGNKAVAAEVEALKRR